MRSSTSNFGDVLRGTEDEPPVTRRSAARRCARRLGALIVLPSLAIAATVTLDDLHSEIDAGHFEAAASQAADYLEAHPGDRDARFLHARALAGRGEIQAAIDAYEDLATDYPLRPEPANNLAVLHAERGELETARDWLEKALATQPAYATAHRNLGDVYTALAELAYRNALDSDAVDSKTPLTLLDRFYYAQESVAPGQTEAPAPVRRPVTGDTSEPDPAAPADDDRSILQSVRAWAIAWSNQDFAAYTDFYAEDFDPGDDLSRAQWLSVRKARLARPDDIHIHIDAPQIERIAEDRVRVSFTQRYQSPRYSDRTRKRLLLTRTDGGWRILRETTVDEGR